MPYHQGVKRPGHATQTEMDGERKVMPLCFGSGGGGDDQHNTKVAKALKKSGGSDGNSGNFSDGFTGGLNRAM